MLSESTSTSAGATGGSGGSISEEKLNYQLTVLYTPDDSNWPDYKVLAANSGASIGVVSAVDWFVSTRTWDGYNWTPANHTVPSPALINQFVQDNLPTTDYIIDQTPWLEYGLSSQITGTGWHANGYRVSDLHPYNLGGQYYYSWTCNVRALLTSYRWVRVLETATNTVLTNTHDVITISYSPPANHGDTNAWPTPYTILYKNDL